MSDRPLIKPVKIIDQQDMSSSIDGPATIIQRLPGISYEVSWDGSPTGTFSIQVSNSYSQDASGNPINSPAPLWTSLDPALFTSPLPAPAGSAGNGFIDVLGTEAYAVRIVYNATGGSGNLTVIAAAKVW